MEGLVYRFISPSRFPSLVHSTLLATVTPKTTVTPKLTRPLSLHLPFVTGANANVIVSFTSVQSTPSERQRRPRYAPWQPARSLRR